MKFYSGIGSRKIPKDIKPRMINLAKILNTEYYLRSGNANGSDQAFAEGVEDNKAQIWLPWKDFNLDFQKIYPKHQYRLVGDNCTVGESDDEAWDSINQFHPNGSKLSHSSRLFMVRNYRQVRGLGEPDSQFVICWTEGGEEVGGTAQAIRIARHFHIPVYNMFHMSNDQILKEIEKLNMLQ